MKMFLRFFKQYPKESVLAPLFKLLEACFDLLVPLVVAAIIDDGISGDGGKSLVFRMVIVLVILAFVGLVCAVAAQYFAAKAAVGGAARLRHDLFVHIQSFTYAQTDKVGTSTLMTRLTSDINQLQSGVNMTLRLLLRSPIIVFGAAILAFTVDTRLALIFIITIPVLAAVVFAIMLGGIPLYKKVQGRLDRVTGATRENLNGIRVIRAFCKEDEEVEKFNRINREQTAYQNKAGYLSSAMNPLTYIIINLATVILLQQGAFRMQIPGSDLTQGEMVALINYMSQILIELVKLANTVFLVTKAMACGNRVQAVLDMPAGHEFTADTATKEGSAVSFEHVSMSYHKGGEPSLRDVHFSVSPGQTVGIIGGTGSGKSTLVNLIPRFYDATEGRVTVLGRDVRSYQPDELRALIGVVPQKAVLFKGTIRDNLLWGKADASDLELWQALSTAQAADFVKEKDGQLDAPVAQRGKNFSGGQKQRLTVARALVGEKPILILDDSASALDFATEAHLRKALQALPHRPTTFIVSQRTASVRFADLIIVLDNGEVCGMGRHDDLMASCQVYREIYESQFKGGEGA